jgi:inorganic pyrophosphatase
MEKEQLITVLVESPKGYRQKFDFEPESKRMKLSELLPEGLMFPFEFGMIPNTKGEDGDPLDINHRVVGDQHVPGLFAELPPDRRTHGRAGRTRWQNNAQRPLYRAYRRCPSSLRK